MKGAIRNIVVKFTQAQAMNEDFHGERVFDAVALRKVPDGFCEEQFFE